MQTAIKEHPEVFHPQSIGDWNYGGIDLDEYGREMATNEEDNNDCESLLDKLGEH